jgi:hypothetical protein
MKSPIGLGELDISSKQALCLTYYEFGRARLFDFVSKFLVRSSVTAMRLGRVMSGIGTTRTSGFRRARSASGLITVTLISGRQGRVVP